MAAQRGYEITPEELANAWSSISQDSELSDFELELVAGGCTKVES